MIDVYLDGIKQIDGVNYTVGNNSVGFSIPPGMGSCIEVQSLGHTIARILGDGQSYLFQMTIDQVKQNSLISVLTDAIKYQEVPAVSEALERLIVVIELVRQEQ